MMMNPKIFVGAAAAAMAAVLVGILAAGPAMVADVPSSPSPSPSPPPPSSTGDMPLFGGDDSSSTTATTAAQILPLRVTLGDIELKKISDRSATLEVSFVLYNPNQRSMIVQTLDYRLFETSYYGDEGALSGGQIGTRPEGLVEFGSNYYTLLSDASITLRDSMVIQNTGDAEFWQALRADAISWHVTGDVFYNLSSMTSGQENRLSFEFAH